MRYLLLVVPIVLLLAMPVFGASSYLGGYSGLIYTPDTLTIPAGNGEISYHDTLQLFGGEDVKAIGLLYGITSNLEVGLSFLNNTTSATAVNGKYRILNETEGAPSLAVGVFDIGNSSKDLSGNPGVYLVLSKDVHTWFHNPEPVSLSIGGGSGVFNGLFASLDWGLTKTISLQGEVNGGSIEGQGNLVNVGVRWAALPSLRVDAAFAGFKEFAFGASFRAKIQQ